MASTSMEVEKKVKKMIKLRSSDGDTFEVEENVAMESRKIKNSMMIQEYNCAGETVIPLPIIPSNILARVIEYCKKHVSESHGESLTAWDAEFVNLDNNTLYDLCVAATYLDIKGLVRLTEKNMRKITLEQFNRLSDLKLKNIKDVMRALKDCHDIQYFNIEEELARVLAMRTSEELRMDLYLPFV
ncbi:SKP1-like protein 4 [Quercus suber]|uniref:Skp1-like protein 4 n=1 Tax=Quercus suber TaxID=58331 RepID=A0AAW0MAI2_QUESU|nr:SKP1-like protein 4 [Quercus suber]POF22012.1 skp1-like protein 4 [Quercus suber]